MTIDAAAVPDPGTLAECFREGFEEVLALGGPHARVRLPLRDEPVVDEPVLDEPVLDEAVVAEPVLDKVVAEVLEGVVGGAVDGVVVEVVTAWSA